MSSNATVTSPDTVDSCLDLLSNQYRRFLLYYLREHGDATLTELTDVLTGWLATLAGTDADRRRFERTDVSLRHVYLPELRAADLVEYDRETGVVTLESYPTWVDDYLDLTFRVEATAERPQSLQDLTGE